MIDIIVKFTIIKMNMRTKEDISVLELKALFLWHTMNAQSVPMVFGTRFRDPLRPNIENSLHLWYNLGWSGALESESARRSALQRLIWY